MQKIRAIFAKAPPTVPTEHTWLLHRQSPTKPSLWRRMTAPAAPEVQVDRYTSFPQIQPRRPTIVRKLKSAVRDAQISAEQRAHAARDKAELGIFRLMLHAAVCCVPCCWRRR